MFYRELCCFCTCLAVPAEVVVLTSNSSVNTGTTTLLTCVGYGVPTPTITWEKSGDSLMNDTRVCTPLNGVARWLYLFVSCITKMDCMLVIRLGHHL